jgi:aminomethyltransferase
MAATDHRALKQTPLAEVHPEWGARMVEFGGWLMPVQYSGILEEHQAVRTAAGLFDISHMGEIFVSGPDSAAWLNRVLTHDVSRLQPGQGQYTLLLNEKGGVIDDLFLYQLAPARYFLVVNASKIDEDTAWLRSHLPAGGVELENRSDAMAALALQGPAAAAVFAAFFGASAPVPARHHLISLSHQGTEVLAARTGYTGEDGFEFFFPAAKARTFWENVLQAGKAHGIKPCGLGARDTLRLEVCYPLNGNDLTPDHTPIEAGLSTFVSLEKEADFPGKEILRRQKAAGTARKLVAFRMTGKSAPPRAHYLLHADGRPVGEVTSGSQSPSLGCGIGMGYVETAFARPGQAIEVEVRGNRFPAEIAKKPLYKKL